MQPQHQNCFTRLDRLKRSSLMRISFQMILPFSSADSTALSGRYSCPMRKTLLHGLFPVVRAEILQLLFTNPRQELYVRELARLSFLSLQTVQDELAKLEAADLISSRTNGYHRFYHANPKHALYATLRRMVIKEGSHPKPATPARGTRAWERRSISKPRKK